MRAAIGSIGPVESLVEVVVEVVVSAAAAFSASTFNRGRQQKRNLKKTWYEILSVPHSFFMIISGLRY